MIGISVGYLTVRLLFQELGSQPASVVGTRKPIVWGKIKIWDLGVWLLNDYLESPWIGYCVAIYYYVMCWSWVYELGCSWSNRRNDRFDCSYSLDSIPCHASEAVSCWCSSKYHLLTTQQWSGAFLKTVDRFKPRKRFGKTAYESDTRWRRANTVHNVDLLSMDELPAGVPGVSKAKCGSRYLWSP